MYESSKKSIAFLDLDVALCIPMLNLRMSQVKKSIVFLDLDVAVCNARLESTVHVKPTDRHQYWHYSSSYPEHTRRSIVFSQTLRVSIFVLWKRIFEIIASK